MNPVSPGVFMNSAALRLQDNYNQTRVENDQNTTRNTGIRSQTRVTESTSGINSRKQSVGSTAQSMVSQETRLTVASERHNLLGVGSSGVQYHSVTGNIHGNVPNQQIQQGNVQSQQGNLPSQHGNQQIQRGNVQSQQGNLPSQHGNQQIQQGNLRSQYGNQQIQRGHLQNQSGSMEFGTNAAQTQTFPRQQQSQTSTRGKQQNRATVGQQQQQQQQQTMLRQQQHHHITVELENQANMEQYQNQTMSGQHQAVYEQQNQANFIQQSNQMPGGRTQHAHTGNPYQNTTLTRSSSLQGLNLHTQASTPTMHPMRRSESLNVIPNPPPVPPVVKNWLHKIWRWSTKATRFSKFCHYQYHRWKWKCTEAKSYTRQREKHLETAGFYKFNSYTTALCPQ